MHTEYCDHELIARVSPAGDDFTACNLCGGHWSGAPDDTEEDGYFQVMLDISPHAEKTLDFLEGSGLNPEDAAMVCAAVLCAFSKDVGTAHKMVDFIDHLSARIAKEDK